MLLGLGAQLQELLLQNNSIDCSISMHFMNIPIPTIMSVLGCLGSSNFFIKKSINPDGSVTLLSNLSPLQSPSQLQ